MKRRSYKCVVGKILYCNKRDGEKVGHIIRNLVILNREFYMEKFRPYQIGHTKRPLLYLTKFREKRNRLTKQ